MRSTLTSGEVRIGAAGVTRAFGPVVANADVDLRVRGGTIHAVVGENGAGKTTLMRLLYGLDRPDSGTVLIDGRPVRLTGPADALARGIGIVQQELAIVPELTMLENLVLGAEPRRRGMARALVDWDTARARARELAQDTGVTIDWDAPAATAPIGARQQLEILRLLYRRADVLILDEPTAALAPAQVDELLRLLRGLRTAGHTIVFISHKLDEVRAIADEITVLRGGRSVATVAAADVDRESLAALVVGGDAPAPVRAIVDDLRPGAAPATARSPAEGPAPPADPAAGPRAAAGPDAAERTDAGDRMDTAAKPGVEGKPGRAAEPGAEGGSDVTGHVSAPALSVDGLAADDNRGIRRLSGCSFDVRAGEIVAVAGVSGNGQQELVECVVGLRRVRAGRIRLRGVDVTRAGTAARRAAGMAYVAADRRAEGLALDQSLTDNVIAGFHRSGPVAGQGWRRGWLRHGRVGAFVRGVLSSFSVRHGSLDDPAVTLSGGNQQRLVVGRELAHAPAVLVAAQPTRGVDVRGTADLRVRLSRAREAGTAILLVSEDLDEVLSLADRVVVLADGRVSGELPAGAGRAELGRLMLGSRANA